MSIVKTTLKFDIRQIETTPARNWNRISSGEARIAVRFIISSNGSSFSVNAASGSPLPFIYTAEVDLQPQSTYNVVAEITSLDGVGNIPIQSAAQTITTNDTEEYINIMMYFKLRTTDGKELAPPAGIVLKIFDTENNRQIGTSPLFTSRGSLDNNLAAGRPLSQIDFPLDGINVNHACFIQRIGKNEETKNAPYEYWLEAEVEFGGETYRYRPATASRLDVGMFQFFRELDFSQITPARPFSVFTLQQVV